MKILNKYWYLLLIIPSVWALFVPGYGGLSDDMHIAWLQQMWQTILSGKWPPRYVPDLSYGFGYPLFNFVFPLPFYLGSLFHLASLTFVGSLKAVFGVSLIGSFATMYWLLSCLTTPLLSFVGATVYLYSPYRSTDVYVRGAVGESLAFIFLPIIVLSILRLNQSVKWLGVGSLAIAGLILTHNISAYMFLPTVFILSLMMILKSREIRYLLRSLSMYLGGLLTSLFFWLPALLDSNLIKYDTVFNFLDHFPTIRQLITPHFDWGASVPGPYDGMSFFIGLPNLILIFFAIIVFIKKFSLNQKDRSRHYLVKVWTLVIFCVSLVMMNYRSAFIWQGIPLIAYFQFPWRFLTLTTFTSSLSVIFLKDIKWQKWLSLTMITICLFYGVKYFRYYQFNGWEDHVFINRYLPIPSPSEYYRQTGEEYLRLTKVTSTRPANLYPRFFSNENVKFIGLIEENAFDAQVQTEVKEKTEISYNKYYFPGWQVKIDGKSVSAYAGQPFGQIAFQLEPGKHSVSVRWKETVRNKFFNGVSLISFFVLFLLVVNLKRKYEK